MTFPTTYSLHWGARRALERLADLRVLVMEATTRGSDATAAWLNSTPTMPTLVVVNQLPNGNAGTHGRMAIDRLHEGFTAPVDVLRPASTRGVGERSRARSPGKHNR